MRFDTPSHIEAVVWRSRLADIPRAQNRTVINRLFNGEPPYDKAKAEENNVEVNRNFLEGTRLLTDARSQWNANFLKSGDFFTVRLDSGPTHKRREWGHIITKNLNRRLKRHQGMIEQVRATGAATLLHGIGPVMWADRRTPIPEPIPLGSLLIASDTDIDFENLEWFAVFRELTPAQLYLKTHGPKVDPGWNLDLVEQHWKYIKEQDQKQANASVYQWMPERIEELAKQDLGLWGSDAVPTADVWDIYFREGKDGDGWYRRTILDWGVADSAITEDTPQPESRNVVEGKGDAQFLYTSGKRKYANSWREIIHCQFGDCSCVAPFKYHSIRSLGWMLWGVCDIQNRLRCKMTEQAFSDLMWWFRVASQNDFNRIKKAQFMQMGVIPNGIDFLKKEDRYTPDATFIEQVVSGNRQLMAENASSFTRQMGEDNTKEMTATEVMARTNSVNTLVSGVMNLAYTYEAFKYREICRRFCIKNSPDRDAREFRKACLSEGVPDEYLDIERWDIEPERALGAGNKTVEMAIVQYLNTVRKNLGPDGQRKVDHIGIEVVTEQADLAEDLAPVAGQKQVSRSAHDAQLATDRLMRLLPFTPEPEMVYEDYVVQWLKDMTMIIGRIQQTGAIGTPQEVMGLQNMAAHVGGYLKIMASDDENKPKVRALSDALGKLMNLVKAFAQRQAEMAKKAGAAGNGDNGAELASKVQANLILAKTKAETQKASHAQRTAERQVAFDLEQQRKDRETAAEIRRENARTAHELRRENAFTAQELTHDKARTAQELATNAIQSATEAAQAAEEPQPETPE